MRDEGIPTSQQPKSQSKNASAREYSYDVPKDGGVFKQSQYNNKQKIEAIKIDLTGRLEKQRLTIGETLGLIHMDALN